MSTYCKYYRQIRQVSYDGGQTWQNVVPEEYQKGALYQSNSTECDSTGSLTRWVNSGTTCNGVNKHYLQVKQISTDGGQNWSNVVPTETQIGSLIEENSTDCGGTGGGSITNKPYLSFYVDQNNTTFSFTNTLQYSTNSGQSWTTLTAGSSTPYFQSGTKVIWKGNLTPIDSVGIGTFSSTGYFYAEGNPMSLLYGDDFVGQTSLSGKDYAFYQLFANCDKITRAKGMTLLATTLSTACYGSMFYNCTSLVNAPNLNATALTDYCYGGMFYGCTSLQTSPTLPATTLADYCYYQMFYGCTMLSSAPQLLATTLVSNCYSYMFAECTALRYIKAMFTTTPSSSYTNQWVYNIASNGTFYKNANATWDVFGVNGIPNGWTVQTASS